MHQSTAAAPILSFKLTLRHKRFFVDGKFSYLVPHGWPKVGARKRTDAPLPALSAINSAAVSAPYIACENSRFSTLLAKRSPAAMSEEKRLFSQASPYRDTSICSVISNEEMHIIEKTNI